MKSRKPQIALLLAALLLVGTAAAFMHGSGEGGAGIRMAGQVGIVAELLESTAKHLESGPGKRLKVKGGSKLDFLQNSDCCAATTAWGMGAGSLQGAVMCPDAAVEFLKDNEDFISLGPIMFNSDVFMTNTPDGNVRKVGMSHKRSHQLVMARSTFRETENIPMLPVGLPYALKKGEVEAIIVDLGVAAGLDGLFSGWGGTPLPTQILVLRKDFAQSEAFHEFATAFGRAREDIMDKYAGSGLLMPELELFK